MYLAGKIMPLDFKQTQPKSKQTVLPTLSLEYLTGFDQTEFYLLFRFLTVVFCHDLCSPQLL